MAAPSAKIDLLFFSAPRVSTFLANVGLTNASGFFFQRSERLFLVTSRHVVFDAPSQHFPDRLEIELHTNTCDLTLSTGFSILLYRSGKAVWRQAKDAGGEIDVAVVELDREKLPSTAVICAYTPAHLVSSYESVAVGEPLLVVGFPLGFHDGVHHLPVLRQGVIASPFGIRFQGKGYFLTDARTHRGTSGAPVVTRMSEVDAQTSTLPWLLLGVHSSRMDVHNRDMMSDECLGLNCVWYADILLKLTEGASLLSDDDNMGE